MLEELYHLVLSQIELHSLLTTLRPISLLLIWSLSEFLLLDRRLYGHNFILFYLDRLARLGLLLLWLNLNNLFVRGFRSRPLVILIWQVWSFQKCL